MRRAACLSVLVLLGLLGSRGHAAGDEIKSPAGKLLSVKVRTIDTLGKPIAGALIEVWQSGGEGQPWWTVKRISVNDRNEAHTGEDGSVSISFALTPDLPTYQGPRVGFCLTAQAQKYLATRVGRIDPVPNDHFEIVLILRRLVSLEGRVVDQQGRPVVDAAVFHTGNATRGTVPLYATEVKTDAEGRFRLDGLPEGKSPVFVTRSGYHFHGQLVDTSAKLSQHELKLLPVDQTPPKRQTLPPLRSHEEEMSAARKVIRPVWEAGMKKAAGDGEREWYCEWYAHLEPWAAYDYVNAHLSKQSKNRFVAWKMPLLYVADAEEALAALESLDTSNDMKAFGLLNTVAEAPRLSRQQKLGLLDRAAQHLRATTDPDERILRLSRVAARLFELGKVSEAKNIVESITPSTKQLSPKTNAAALAYAGEAISLFDLPAGLQLIRAARDADNDDCWILAMFHVAYRIADKQPAEAEQLAAEARDSSRRSYLNDFRRTYHRDPSEEDLCKNNVTGSEIRFIPLCYHLAAASPVRAQQVAATIQNPHVRAYATGIAAKALASSDKATARRLILQAYDILTESCRNSDRRWPQDYWQYGPPTVAAALLPVVEEIDPTLVGQCMWRAISFRLPRTADTLVLKLEPENNDASLAAFVARYDRGLARALVPKVDVVVSPMSKISSRSAFTIACQLPAIAAIDVNEALGELRTAAASPGGDPARCFYDALYVLKMLPTEWPHRWDFLAAQYRLWIPDNQYAGDSHTW